MALVRNGAAVRATGKLVPGRNGALEMQAAAAAKAAKAAAKSKPAGQPASEVQS
mgnify:CR=1 FL=1